MTEITITREIGAREFSGKKTIIIIIIII